MKQIVLKASGEKELFSGNKIYRGLLNTSASPEITNKTIKEVNLLFK